MQRLRYAPARQAVILLQTLREKKEKNEKEDDKGKYKVYTSMFTAI